MQTIRRILRFHLNPAMDGSFFEHWFFSKLKFTGITATLREGKEIKWDRQLTPFESQVPASSSMFIGASDIWVKPRGWSQPGFDVMRVRPSDKVIEFVQV